jgi:quinol monooxygenase YgiN
MSIHIITQFRTKDGCSEGLIDLIAKVLPDSLDHEGCVEVSIRQNQDDPNDIISVQQWASRAHYESYRAWRQANGVTASIEEFLVEPIAVRYFDDVAMDRLSLTGAATAADASQGKMPEKVGSADALGG